MARARQQSKRPAAVSAYFPYRNLMDHPAWAVVDATLGELETNHDVELMTARRYVVGSLVRQLVDHGLTPPGLPVQLASGTTRYR
jgi:hypothetical protein